jgi:hypothetical protein
LAETFRSVDMAKCVILFNGPSMPIDGDFGGLPVIALNWAARRRRFRGIAWWVSYIAQRCDKMMWEEAGSVAKVVADCSVGVKTGFFDPLGWKIDRDLSQVRMDMGRGSPRNLDSVVDTFSLALHLGFDEIDVYGWEVQDENHMPRFLWARKMAATRDLVSRKRLKINRIGGAPLREVTALHVKPTIPYTPAPRPARLMQAMTPADMQAEANAYQADEAARRAWHDKTTAAVANLGVSVREVVETPWHELYLHDVPAEALAAVQSIAGVTVEMQASYELPDATPTPGNLEAAAEARKICEEYQGKTPVVSPPSTPAAAAVSSVPVVSAPEMDRRAALCGDCAENQGVSREVQGRAVNIVKCRKCGCGGLSLAAACPDGKW